MARRTVSTSLRFGLTSLVALLALSLVLVLAAWRMFQQDRALARQRQTEARELGADSAVALFLKQFARLEQELRALAEGGRPSDNLATARGSLFVRMDARNVTCWPEGGLPFRPVAIPLPAPEVHVAELEAADRLEFAQGDYVGALNLVSTHRNSRGPQAQASALVREGRLLRKLSRWDAAASSYEQLARLGEVPAGGIPAILAARAGELETQVASGNAAAAQSAARKLFDELLTGRHQISQATFDLLSEAALRQQPALLEQAKPSIALAEAAQTLWDGLDEPGSPGSWWVATRYGPVLVVDRRTSTGLVAYLAAETAVRNEWLGPVEPALRNLGLEIALATPDGRAVTGTPPRSGHSARLAQATGLPWSVMVFPDPARPPTEDTRGALLTGGLAVLLCGVAVAMWLANRAVARELELAKLKSEFVATVSHEFRTPLTAIRQLSELLVTGRVASVEDRREYYRLLATQGERLHRLVEGLLNFGRLDAGRLKLQKERLDAAGFALRETADFEQQPAARGYRIECSVTPEPVMVEADPDALRLSLANVLENAVKYSPGADSVDVKVTAGNGRVEIAVSDFGPGIDPGERDRIFEKFVRGRAALAENIPGTGIGLAMARELMRAQGGDIELASDLGKGSTFTLVLPRVD